MGFSARWFFALVATIGFAAGCSLNPQPEIPSDNPDAGGAEVDGGTIQTTAPGMPSSPHHDDDFASADNNSKQQGGGLTEGGANDPGAQPPGRRGQWEDDASTPPAPPRDAPDGGEPDGAGIVTM